MLDKPLLIARGMIHRFPDGHDPFQIMTRLLEECGELAQQVNHFEGSGVKRAKHGEPDREALAKEVRQALIGVLQIAVYYGIERKVEESLEWSFQRLCQEGHIQV
jgi:NTP pyrophosphatase (non-canonical NTP hydrolase)